VLYLTKNLTFFVFSIILVVVIRKKEHIMANFKEKMNYKWRSFVWDMKYSKDARNNFLTCVFFVVVFGCAFVWLAKADKKAKEKEEAQKKLEQVEKERQAKRAHDFADYIIEDVRAYAIPSKRSIREWCENYKFDPGYWDGRIQDLVSDSTKYANAIYRDAWCIQKLHPNISFEAALKWIDEQSSVVVGPKYEAEYNMGVSHGEEVIKSVSYVPSGKTEVKGSNHSAEYKMKVNKRHLKEISLKLAQLRAGRNLAQKNLER
jgi:preprotein translocase subunit SecG